jgi:hypothetical protein
MNSDAQAFERDTLCAVLGSKRVWLLHVLGNALLMIAFFYWTRIPDETGWDFAVTVCTGFAIALAALWLHSATFAYFATDPERSLANSFRRVITHIPAFLLWLVGFGIVLWLIAQLWQYDQQVAGWVRHLLPLWLRRQISPRAMFSACHWSVWLLYFFLWPVLLLPVGAQVALRNFRGFSSSAAFQPIRSLRFWLTYLVCFLVGAYCPYALAGMVPRRPSSLRLQEWSMGLRLGVGYLLLVTAWLVLCAAIVRASGGEFGLAGSKLRALSASRSEKFDQC